MKIFKTLAIIVFVVSQQFFAAAQFCEPPQSIDPCSYMHLKLVETTGGLENFINTSGCASASYTDYSASKKAKQVAGGSLTLNLNTEGYAYDYAVWIDFDDDQTFEPAEKVISFESLGTAAVSLDFTVPADAPVGVHRMRVRGDYSVNTVPDNPCNQLQYGETEDYSFEVGGTSCSNPTSGGTIGVAQTVGISSTPASLAETVAPAGSISGTLQYKWQSSTTSAAAGFADISGATSSGYQAGALSQTTWYKRLVKVDCESAWLESNVLEITVVAAVTWTGSTSTDWNTAGNWNPAVVPTAAVDVLIPVGLTNYPVIGASTNAQVKNLTHNGTATERITVNNGGKLTMNGSYVAVSGSQIEMNGQ